MTAKIIPVPKTIRKNLTGMRFGKLIVVGFSGREDGSTYWLCRCDCGREKVIAGRHLVDKTTRGCGCLAYENSKKHGMSGTPEYAAWKRMIKRCQDPNDHNFSKYGARGIKVCRRWRVSFESFYEDMGPRPSPIYSLDRIDNNKGYSPDNCRWATRTEQANNRTSNRIVTFSDKTQTVTQWAREVHLNPKAIQRRLAAGWSIEDTLTTPVKKRRKG